MLFCSVGVEGRTQHRSVVWPWRLWFGHVGVAAWGVVEV